LSCNASCSSRGCSFKARAVCFDRVHNARAAHGPQSVGRNFTAIDAAPVGSTCGDHDEETFPSGQVTRCVSQSTVKWLAS
jgi:hypothetical protein